MRRTVLLYLILPTLALVWGGGITSCLAYYPPLQDVTGPTLFQDQTQTKVTVSVHNPATGQDIPGVWSIPGSADVIEVDQITRNQGMVAWRVKDKTDNKYQIVVGVYDPNPVQGWQFYRTSWSVPDTHIVLLNDGILLCECKYTTSPAPGWFYYFLDIYMVTYDPSLKMPGEPWAVGWKTNTASYFNNFPHPASGFVCKDGVVAYVGLGMMEYSIYDGLVHGWFSNGTYAPNPTAPSVTAATVTWTDNAGAQKRGYDYTELNWKTDFDTMVVANFAFAPFEPRPNQFVYFTDMSIGATAWNWALGDTATSPDRSPYHKYVKPGNYSVSQQVSGPAGNDANTQTVPVKSPVDSGMLILLLMDG